MSRNFASPVVGVGEESPGLRASEGASPASHGVSQSSSPGPAGESARMSIAMSLGGSPASVRRAGLLQPRVSFSASQHSRPSGLMRPHPNMHLGLPHSHSKADIRQSTMQISNMSLHTPHPGTPTAHSDAFIFPTPALDPEPIAGSVPSVPSIEEEGEDLSASTATLATMSSGSGYATPRGTLGSPGVGSVQPSGLTLMMQSQSRSVSRAREEAGGRGQASSRTESTVEDEDATRTPTMERPNSTPHPRARTSQPPPPRAEESDESAPLLSELEAGRYEYGLNGTASAQHAKTPRVLSALNLSNWKKAAAHNTRDIAVTAVRSLPAVVLGMLLNILDGVSYGMIVFPAAGVFAGLGGAGVSMFFVTAVVSQLVYSAGGSGFAGANGSMMIEVVPFFHLIANSIAEYIGEDRPHEVLATTAVAFALSSVLTGLAFLLLGALRMGSLIGFFPRHILVGCIGGVGVFLIITGLTVSTRMADDDFALNLATLRYLFLDANNFALWAPAFGLAVLLRAITHRWDHQLIFPIYFLTIPVLFYIIVAIARLDLGTLRATGWIFDMGTAREPWYHFYSFYDVKATHWGALWATLPTQFALLFFNVLHPPLNVPALAVSLNHDTDTDKELVAHGYSNLLAGALGTVPNYLVYVNTLLFYRVGGDNRTAGFLLAGATALLLFIGAGPIAYIPVMVVGALIFVLGIDLVKEALWDTRHRVSRTEYFTIVSIMVCMTVWDFVIGVLFGIVMSCFFFVVQSSQRRSIRALHTGETVLSTVRRPSAHRAYIREVSKQTSVLRLQGFLFFGTITNVEETIRALVEGPAWQRTPMRFLVLDLSLVWGVDMSAAEAFVRVQRLLASRRVVLVFCGIAMDSPVDQALRNVELLGMHGVEAFSTFSSALEWTENVYLRAWFAAQKVEAQTLALPGRELETMSFQNSLSTTPRRSHLLDAGLRTIARDHSPPEDQLQDVPEPYNTLVKCFSSFGPMDRAQYAPLLASLHRVVVPEGTVLWHQDAPSDGLYFVQSGILRAVYRFNEHTPPMEESMVPGTLAGELSAVSGEPRNATCVVERAAVLWKLSREGLRRLEEEHPELAGDFTRLVLKAAKLDYDILIAALATRQ